ncbi:MAG: 5-oxoprolinase (ATP-hydrolyzing) subunit [Actinomycetota bacterium]|nr:5-oxoprolinase (ATP-hydrolyzing) subunit [Actinomycetota bacterium]
MNPPRPSIDLNSDLGEGFGAWVMGDDEAMLGVVTSANVACGFHAGDPDILRRVCAQAAERGVAIGAHVGYDDLSGFGRRAIDVEPGRLTNDVIYQLAALDGFARVAGTRVRYVKPHGALYNTAAGDKTQAASVVEAIRLYDESLPVLGLPGSALLTIADEVGIPAVAEAFADRGYTPEGNLVPRSQPGALLHDPEQVARRMIQMVTTGRVEATDGTQVSVRADSICVHGDSPGALEMAVAVRRALVAAGVDLRPFAA